MFTLFLPIFLAASASAQTGQPQYPSTGSGTFQIVGDSGVSAQQLFVGTANKVYIIDKTENNPLKINNHPAWATEYSLNNNSVRAMDVVTNTFCAGGTVMGDGTWINVGGNQAITYGGEAINNTSQDLYKDKDGGFAVRFLKPCDDATCNWVDDPKNYITTRRWYPTLETLADGSVIMMSGSLWGGYVSGGGNNNPTYEFWPSQGEPVYLPFLDKTVPLNLYPLIYLLPSNRLFLATYQSTQILDYNSGDTQDGPDIPYSARTYPANAAVTMLPQTAANNWTATVIFCGGTVVTNGADTWNVKDTTIVDLPADNTCVRISPDDDNTFSDDDDLPEGRVMGNFILLPNGKIFLVNGVGKGTAGYGNDTWAIGQSYADQPILQPLMYDPEAPKGSRFSQAGLSASSINRMYHSTASLLADGSIIVSGSNPNADFVNYGTYQTEYRTERFFPDYYSERRPEPAGLPQTISYGGNYFTVSLSSDDLGSDAQSSLQNTKVVLMRFGFSTHAVNFGQRYYQLNNTWQIDGSGKATLSVSQLPPNPAALAPGPAWLFVVVNGIPSVGVEVMVGSGKVATQNTTTPTPLPASFAAQITTSASPGATNGGSSANQKSGAEALRAGNGVLPVIMVGVAALVGALAVLL